MDKIIKAKVSGKFIRKFRKTIGITQVELSEKVGITQGCLSKYENGMKIPFDHMIEMLKVLGIKVQFSLEKK